MMMTERYTLLFGQEDAMNGTFPAAGPSQVPSSMHICHQDCGDRCRQYNAMARCPESKKKNKWWTLQCSCHGRMTNIFSPFLLSLAYIYSMQ